MMNELKHRGNWKFRREVIEKGCPQAYEPVTAKDVDSMRELLEQTGRDEARFLKFMDVARIEEIRQGELQKALTMLRSTVRYNLNNP